MQVKVVSKIHYSHFVLQRLGRCLFAGVNSQSGVLLVAIILGQTWGMTKEKSPM